MSSINLSEIRRKISELHEGDEKQLEVIFSDSPRLIVEAPAGYGKTTTMISRIAYLFASGGIPNPKRILGLTFSVNAALKVKRDVAEKLPSLLGAENSPVALGEKVTVTNYHGFCKGVLKKYGYLVADALRKDINLFRAIGELKNNQGNITAEWREIANTLTTDEQNLVVKVDSGIKSGILPDPNDVKNYNSIISRKLMPLDSITHNTVILLVLEIFGQFCEVKRFYQSYYPLIVVDEFQDTNCIAWSLLEALISDSTQLMFLGDPLQRIYGFIGALPNIMDTATNRYNMTKIALSKNYRFRYNPDMLKLDNNMRENAASCFAPTISEDSVANLPAFWGATQQEEAQQVVAKVQLLMQAGTDRVTLLFRGRGRNAEIFEAELVDKNIPYFYGMFTDEDADYIAFHRRCQELFIRKFGKTKNITIKSLSAFSDSVKGSYAFDTGKTIDSLLRLLDALIKKVTMDYIGLLSEDKYNLLLDIFENRQLKQAMEYVDSQIILSTIHGAKGLEWDYVFLCDIEQWVMTFICRACNSSDKNNSTIGYCRLPQVIPDEMRGTILDDLCVFYVGLTRARKQAFISASAQRFNAAGREFMNGKICCLAMVDGVKLVNAHVEIGS